MKVYTIFLVIILVAVIAFGVWYCISAYNEQSSTEKGLLVESSHRRQEFVQKAGNI